MHACSEESDLSSCINYILQSLKRDCSKLDGKCDISPCFPTKPGLSISILSLQTLQKDLDRIKNTPVEKYQFETFCHALESHGLRKCPARACEQIIYFIFSVVLLLSMVVTFSLDISFDEKVVFAQTVMTFIFGIVAIILELVIEFLRRHVLFLRSSLCTNTVTVLIRIYIFYTCLIFFIYNCGVYYQYFTLLKKSI